ncbi:MAG TPA: carboxypeptidase-like regulatory domain-containing protein, partial [Acidobacteriaceae bacterium]
MMKRWMQAALIAVLGLCLGMSSMPTQAQTVTGAVTGTVTDPSGAVVSGAKVTAHNLDTGVDTPTTTNATGFYRIEFLPIGRYEVTIDAGGFTTQK